jgi:hypothetical protein
VTNLKNWKFSQQLRKTSQLRDGRNDFVPH